jgi:hypothetical protein
MLNKCDDNQYLKLPLLKVWLDRPELEDKILQFLNLLADKKKCSSSDFRKLIESCDSQYTLISNIITKVDSSKWENFLFYLDMLDFVLEDYQREYQDDLKICNKSINIENILNNIIITNNCDYLKNCHNWDDDDIAACIEKFSPQLETDNQDEGISYIGGVDE